MQTIRGESERKEGTRAEERRKSSLMRRERKRQKNQVSSVQLLPPDRAMASDAGYLEELELVTRELARLGRGVFSCGMTDRMAIGVYFVSHLLKQASRVGRQYRVLLIQRFGTAPILVLMHLLNASRCRHTRFSGLILSVCIPTSSHSFVFCLGACTRVERHQAGSNDSTEKTAWSPLEHAPVESRDASETGDRTV